MLHDKDMFNVPQENIGKVSSDLTVYSIPFSMFTTCFTSYVFEILGRKWTIFISFMLTAIVFYIVPHTAPHYNYLMAARCMIGITMAPPLSHPLLPDYVKRKSRGKAVAL